MPQEDTQKQSWALPGPHPPRDRWYRPGFTSKAGTSCTSVPKYPCQITAVTDSHRTGGLNNKYSFFTVLEAEKFKV